MDPDSRPPSRRRRFGAPGPSSRRGGGRGLAVSVSDGRGRPVQDGGLARWLASVAPARVRGEVAVALVTDAHIRKLNARYRRKNAATDVLSFASDASTTALRADRASEPLHPLLGDIVIATGTARRQAGEARHSYATELRVLALHGLLHLLGYDHDDPQDGGRMARLEARLRAKGALKEGLIQRASVVSPSQRTRKR